MTTNDPHFGSEPEPHAEPQYPHEGQPQPAAEPGQAPQYPQPPYAQQPPPYGQHPYYGQHPWGQPGQGGQWSQAGQWGEAGQWGQQHQFGPHDPYAPQYQYAQHPGAAEGAPPAAHRRRRGWRLGAGIAALTAAALVGGIAIGDAVSGSSTVAGSGSQPELVPNSPGGLGGLGGLGGSSGSGGSGGSVLPGGGGSILPSGGGTSTSVTLANAKQKVGVVTIVSTLGYQNAQSAGTGMVINSDGEVLTNNHVVNGATSVVVTIASTGKSYRADVVGTAPTQDVAVLKLRNASGLATANLGDASGVSVGDSIIGVGNAGGTGTLRASRGKVTALNQTITASDDGSGSNAERLNGLIEVNAPIISGDSGGPLYDSAGEIIGMDTAASADSAATRAYAIPIDNALKVAQKIESGQESSTVHIGLPAFLGVGVSNASNGAGVSSLLNGGPAAGAGITEGSVITKVGGTAVTSGDGLKSALSKYRPGDKAKITWIDPNGSTHSATVTLGTGPAD